MDPSHTIETSDEIWKAIVEQPAIGALFIGGHRWGGSDRALVRIRDRNARAAVHIIAALRDAEGYEEFSADLADLAEEYNGSEPDRNTHSEV